MDLKLDEDLAASMIKLARSHQSVELELAARLVELALGRSRRDLRLRWARLSARQQQVALLLKAGLSDRQAAAQLHITRETLRSHTGRILQRMKAGSREALIDLMRSAEWEDGDLQDIEQAAAAAAPEAQA